METLKKALWIVVFTIPAILYCVAMWALGTLIGNVVTPHLIDAATWMADKVVGEKYSAL